MKEELIKAAEKCFEEGLWWGHQETIEDYETYDKVNQAYCDSVACAFADTEDSTWFLLMCAESVDF